MRWGIPLSVLLHVLVIAAGYIGLPHLLREPVVVEEPIMVEILQVAEKTNVPTAPPQKAEPKEEPKPEPPKPEPPKPEPPKPEPPKPAPPPPPPPPPPPEKVEPAPPEPEKKAEKKPEEKKPEPKPEPKKPEPEPEKAIMPPRLAEAKVKRKPKPPEDFASVLKTLEDIKKAQPKKDEKPQPKKDSFQEEIAKAIGSPGQRNFDASQPLTISEIDLVRQQIQRCWNIPAGAKDAQNLVVEIRLDMNPDGSVRDARILDTARMFVDSYYRAAAESALRAVQNPKCQPFKLPADKYERWKTMTLAFNPKDML